jgi:hypothetical protein
MELMGLLTGRRAMCASTQKPVTKSVLEGLIDGVVHAPSAANEPRSGFSTI